MMSRDCSLARDLVKATTSTVGLVFELGDLVRMNSGGLCTSYSEAGALLFDSSNYFMN